MENKGLFELGIWGILKEIGWEIGAIGFERGGFGKGIGSLPYLKEAGKGEKAIGL